MTVWPAGARPSLVDEPGDGSGDPVIWCELDPNADCEDALPALKGICDGLDHQMLADLCAPDALPEGQTYGDGQIRLLSMCGVEVEPSSPRERLDSLIVAPIELLAGERWLITRQQPRHRYRGLERAGGEAAQDLAEETRVAVARRWCEGDVDSAGELGLLLMHELMISYVTAYRALYARLEEWELSLYEADPTQEQLDEQRQELRELWHLRAVLRDWITPLNRPGMSLDLEKVWLPVKDGAEAQRIDDRLDRTLKHLSKLGDTLRDSFHLLHFEEQERQRERRDQLQRRIEVIAAIFLIPTFIVGLYGANTWLPGRDREWGFAAMLLVVVIATVVGVVALRRMHDRRGPIPPATSRTS